MNNQKVDYNEIVKEQSNEALKIHEKRGKSFVAFEKKYFDSIELWEELPHKQVSLPSINK